MSELEQPGFARRIVRGIRRRVHAFFWRFSPRRFGNTFRWFYQTASILLMRRREERLTVAIDIASLWENLTGIGWYVFRLLENLAERDDLRLRLYGPTLVESDDMPQPTVKIPEGIAVEWVMYRVPENMVIPAGPLIRLLRKIQPILLAADANQILFAPNYFLPRRYRLATGSLVATVPDLGVHLVPWALRSETLKELTENLDHTLFEATRVLTISEAVRQELAELKLADPRRVKVVHLAPATSDIERGCLPQDVEMPFILHVGTLEPRKNILTLLDAWEILREKGAILPRLVLCGGFGWKTEEIRRRVERAKEEGWLLHPGYATDREVAALYRDALFVVFPTHYEGFGLPAVEAMQAGKALICSDIPVLHEVAGDAAIYVPPMSADFWAEKIEFLVNDEEARRRLSSKALERRELFSWEKTADGTAKAWQEAAKLRLC